MLGAPLGNTVCQSSCVGPTSPASRQSKQRTLYSPRGLFPGAPPPQPRSKPHKKRGPERKKTVGKQEGKEEKAGKLRSAVGLKDLRDILSQGRFAFQGQEFVSVWADSWLNYEDSRGHAFRFQRITWP